MKDKTYSIGDVTHMLGISRDRLRNYEKDGLVVPEREENAYRRYSIAQVYQLLSLQQYREMDLSIREILELFQIQDTVNFEAILRHKEHELSMQIQELQSRRAMVEEVLNDCKLIHDHLNTISLEDMRQFSLERAISTDFDVADFSNFQKDGSIIRHFVRRITFDGSGQVSSNEVYFGRKTGNVRPCVYTVIRETPTCDAMPQTIAHVGAWIEEHGIKIGEYAYIRPMMIQHTGDSPCSYLEIMVPVSM